MAVRSWGLEKGGRTGTHCYWACCSSNSRSGGNNRVCSRWTQRWRPQRRPQQPRLCGTQKTLPFRRLLGVGASRGDGRCVWGGGLLLMNQIGTRSGPVHSCSNHITHLMDIRLHPFLRPLCHYITGGAVAHGCGPCRLRQQRRPAGRGPGLPGRHRRHHHYHRLAADRQHLIGTRGAAYGAQREQRRAGPLRHHVARRQPRPGPDGQPGGHVGRRAQHARQCRLAAGCQRQRQLHVRATVVRETGACDVGCDTDKSCCCACTRCCTMLRQAPLPPR